MKTIWKPVSITEFADKYEVSSSGQIRNLRSGLILTPMRTGSKRNGAQRSKVRFSTTPRLDFDVAHLVLTAFVGPRPTGFCAMHRDDDSTNNAITNLKWGTPTENSRHMAMGTRGGNQRLSASDVADIARRRIAGETGMALAKEYQVSVQRICDIYKGRTSLK